MLTNSPEQSQIQILVVEDDPAIAIDIALNLESIGYSVIGPTHTGQKALEYLEKERVDLAILDIHLVGDLSGIDVAKAINTRYGIPFIYLTSYSDKGTIAEAASTLPATYIVKPFKEEDLAPAIQIALVKARESMRIPSLEIINANRVNKVTQTEYEVICDILDGLSNKEIAAKRFNSPHTIKSHIKSIYLKLEVHGRVELQNLVMQRMG